MITNYRFDSSNVLSQFACGNINIKELPNRQHKWTMHPSKRGDNRHNGGRAWQPRTWENYVNPCIVMALSHLAGSTLRARNECYSSMFVLCPLLSANYVSDKKAMLVVNTFLWGVNFHRPYNINSNNLSRRITPTIMLLALRHRRCSNLEKVYISPCPPGHRGSIVSRSVTYRHTCF